MPKPENPYFCKKLYIGMQKLFSLPAGLILVAVSQSFVVAQTFEWARTSNTTVITTGGAIAADGDGNSYVTGSFFGKCSFGDFELNAEGRDIYLTKYDAQGKALWAKRAGGKADDFGNAVAVDGEGNCFLAGSFGLTVSFGTESVTAKGQHDIFVAKYDTKGDLLWCKQAGGYYDDHAMAISLDKAGNSYVAGYFKDTIWFSPDAMLATGKGISALGMFLAKYDSKGKFLWAKQMGGVNYQTQNEGLAIATDRSGMTYVTGYYQIEATFEEKKLANRGTFALFTAKYDSDGKVLWVQSSSTNASSVIGKGIALDKKGNCYVSGTFTSSATFDTITAISRNLGFPDIFLAKYNSNGTIIWVRTSGGFGAKSLYAGAVDDDGNPYLIGTFRDTAAFGNITLTGAGMENIFLVKYDPSGEVQWGKQMGRHGMLLGKSLSLDDDGNVFITGNFTDTADFGKAHLRAKENTQDVFIAKLSPVSIVKEKKLPEVPSAEFEFISFDHESGSRNATAKFSIPGSSFILLQVDDEMGAVAESYIEGEREAGVYEAKLDLKNFKEGGDYYCRLQAGKEKRTKKLVMGK